MTWWQLSSKAMETAKHACVISALAVSCLIARAGGSSASSTPHSPAVESIVSALEPSASPAVEAKAIVVILTIDGVRWQEVFSGVDARLARTQQTSFTGGRSASELMPNLHRLSEHRGALMGSDSAELYASSANTLSLPGYLEIFSGRAAACASNDCAATSSSTLLDDWLGRDPSSTVAVLSSWPTVARAAARDLSRITLSAGRTVRSLTERLCDAPRLCEIFRSGLELQAWPGLGGYRPDHATAALALEYLRVKQPQFVFIGLGDTDEQAHRGNYWAYLQALHDADRTLGEVNHWLEDKQSQGYRTLLICTSDHGRARGFRHHGGAPEAARVWALFTGSVVKARGHMVAAPSRLADIAPTVREFVGLPKQSGPDAGRSLLPLLAQVESEQQGRIAAVTESQ